MNESENRVPPMVLEAVPSRHYGAMSKDEQVAAVAKAFEALLETTMFAAPNPEVALAALIALVAPLALDMGKSVDWLVQAIQQSARMKTGGPALAIAALKIVLRMDERRAEAAAQAAAEKSA